jgi:hypothetical protein
MCAGALLQLAGCSASSGGHVASLASRLEGDDASTGSVLIEAGVILANEVVECPGISAFSIVPSAVLVGQPAQMTLATVGPVPLVAWTVTGGTVNPADDGGLDSWIFQCAGPGVASVTVAVGLSDTTLCQGQMFTTYSIDIDCQ